MGQMGAAGSDQSKDFLSSSSLQCWADECSCVEDKRKGLWQVETSSSLTLLSSRSPVQLISTMTIFESQVRRLSSMRQGRMGPTLVAMESHGKIVAIGGWDGGFASLNSVEVYDVETNQWSVANPMVPADICLSSFNAVISRCSHGRGLQVLSLVDGSTSLVGSVRSAVQHFCRWSASI